jgi:hypothetical protein
LVQQDIDLETAMLQMPHGMGGYGMTPNVITQISSKVVMESPDTTLIDVMWSKQAP